jgi:hypothetical protein
MSDESPSLAKVNSGKCPKCHGPLYDFRGVMANQQALDADGVCRLWSDNDYRCAGPPAAASRNLSAAH